MVHLLVGSDPIDVNRHVFLVRKDNTFGSLIETASDFKCTHTMPLKGGRGENSPTNLSSLPLILHSSFSRPTFLAALTSSGQCSLKSLSYFGFSNLDHSYLVDSGSFFGTSAWLHNSIFYCDGDMERALDTKSPKDRDCRHNRCDNYIAGKWRRDCKRNSIKLEPLMIEGADECDAHAAPAAKLTKAAAVVAPAILNPFFTIEFFALLRSNLISPKHPHLL